MFRLIGITLALITWGLSSSAQAADASWFEVEVYIFARQSADTEQWPETAIPADTKGAIDLITPVISKQLNHTAKALNSCTAADWATRPDWCNQQLQLDTATPLTTVPLTVAAATAQHAKRGEKAILLADSQSQFKNLISKINKEPGVQGLLHMTWQENMLPRNLAKPIRLYGGKNFTDQYTADGIKIETDDQLIKHFDVLNDYLQPQNDKPVWQLDGTLNIYLNHWLYIETNLVLREEGEKTLTAPQENDSDTIKTMHVSPTPIASEMEKVPFLYAIHMKQNRRVRSDEINYFDHPKLGMLIQIRKMVQPKDMPQHTQAPIKLQSS